MLISLFFVMDFKMIPYANLENLQKPMQIHHPVVKDENYNLYSDHSKSNSICDCLVSNKHFQERKNKWEKHDVDCVCYLLPFSQSNVILTILSPTFLFLTCPLITQMLN